MNLLLVEEKSDTYCLKAANPDFDAVHRIRESYIRMGVVNGPRGLAEVTHRSAAEIRLQVREWEPIGPPVPEVHLFIAYPRPVEVRRILTQAAALVVASLTFVRLERTPPGYAQSRVWEEACVDRLLREGLAQGFHTRLPSVGHAGDLASALARVNRCYPVSFLDPYLATAPLARDSDSPDFPGSVFLGSERGFSRGEQEWLTEQPGLRYRHLGGSILRTETAVVAALAFAHRQTGFGGSCAGAQLHTKSATSPPRP